MHEVGHDVVQQPLVVGDHHHRPLRGPERIDAAGNGLQGVDIEPGVRFIEYRQRRFEHGHLENFVPLLFSARESFIDRPAEERVIHLQQRHPFTDQGHEVHRVKLRLAAVLAHLVQAGFEQIGIVHAGNLDRILEGEKHPFPRPFLRFEV